MMFIGKAKITTAALCAVFFVNGCTANAQARQSDVEYQVIDEYGFNEEDIGSSAVKVTAVDASKYATPADKNAAAYGQPTAYTGTEKFYQKGTASWYGREFQGKITASGERFDMKEFTAAHRELPFGTIIEVKNLKNGNSIRAKVNDRGPYRANRIVDLSYAAANELGYIRDGEANVGITIIKWGNGARTTTTEKPSRTEPVANYYEETPQQQTYSYKQERRGGSLALQAGAFYSRQNAESFKSKLEGLTGRTVSVVNEDDMFKVRVEGLYDKDDLLRTKNLLESENISSFSVDKIE